MLEQIGLTRLLNQLFGGMLASGIHAVGIPADRAAMRSAEILGSFSFELLVVAGLIVFFVMVRLRLSVENPGPVQHLAEIVHERIGELSDQVIGHGYERFQAWVTCIFLFVLFNNLMGLVPGVITPTSEIVVPLGLAAPTFFYYNFYGIREQGLVGYIKHFAGPIWWMAWLILPIEMISHLARILSLTVRLYANMFASDLITLVSFSKIPFGLPVLALGLHAFVSIIQAFVFMLLTMIYLSLAVAHEH